ncbi:MAG: hypothetical protein CMI52_04510 [Parcubacteria group bacterium]|nr:hypothetical protein [Parcubacteria group bacterium]
MPTKEKVDYRNAQVINDILVSDDVEAHETLRRANAWSVEQMVLFAHYIRMRDRSHRQMQLDVARRMEEKPMASDVEMSMGAYIEHVEPQVRAAVVRLREKGYATFSSGYYGRDVQEISFLRDDLDGWEFEDDFVEWLAGRGAHVRLFHGDIYVDLKEQLSEVELKYMWDAIVQNMPDLSRTSPKNETMNAKRFRAAQMNLRTQEAYKKVHRP